jgi:hypothetical protein
MLTAVGEIRNAYTILFGKLEAEKQLGGPSVDGRVVSI